MSETLTRVEEAEWNEDDDPADSVIAVNVQAPDEEDDDEAAPSAEDDIEEDDIEEGRRSDQFPSMPAVIKDQLDRNPPLTVDQERQFTSAYFLTDWNRWRDVMVMSCSRMAFREARKLHRRFQDRGERLEDVFQRCMMGVVDAAERFTPARGVRFISYAGMYLKKYFADLTNVHLQSTKTLLLTSTILNSPVKSSRQDSDSGAELGDMLSRPGLVSSDVSELNKYGNAGNVTKRLDKGLFYRFLRQRLEKILEQKKRSQGASSVAVADNWRLVFDACLVRGLSRAFVATMVNLTRERIRQLVDQVVIELREDARRCPGPWSEWVGITDASLVVVPGLENPVDVEIAYTSKHSPLHHSREMLNKEKDRVNNLVRYTGSSVGRRLVRNYEYMKSAVYQKKPKDLVRHYRPFYGGFYSEWNRYHKEQIIPEMDQRSYDINLACGNITKRDKVCIIDPKP